MYQKTNFFYNQLKKHKKKNALILEIGKIITYENLLKKTKLLSKSINKKKTLIFLLGQNNLETITAYISFVDDGHVVALIDYRINNVLLKNLIEVYKPRIIFCEKNKLKYFTQYKKKFSFKNYFGYEKKFNNEVSLHKDLVLLLSTSGSTGSPKFVRLSYLNLINNTKSIIKYLNISSKDRSITSLPFTYVYGLSVINTHLLSGSSIVLSNRSITEKEFWMSINKYKVNNIAGVPYSYSIFERFFKKNIPKSLKYTTQAGGKMNNKLIKNLLQIYKKNKIKLIQMYGAAEATARMSYLKYEFAKKKIGSIGKPIPGGKFQIISSKKKVINTFKKKGELVYRGKNVSMGYATNYKDLSLPDLNHGILKTGDIAYKDKDGFYYIVGRKNRYVKIFGIRVDLSELEDILFKKGIDSIMKDAGENKINIYFKSLLNSQNHVNFLSEITNINKNVFVVKKLKKKNLNKNYKFKI